MVDETSLRPSSQRKRKAILAAAEVVFVRAGFAVANMDEVAACARVSKQTVYAHFGSKEALFEVMVTHATTAAADAVSRDMGEPAASTDLRTDLERYGRRQLAAVLQPELLDLRRIVIGEATRFPYLAEAFWRGGPANAMTSMELRFRRLAELGLVGDYALHVMARTFNWLLMAAPLNEVALRGNAEIPDERAQAEIAAEAARVTSAAYGA